jgi:hypothetical protein
MKKIVMMTLVFISSAAWSCPNFSGDYSCNATHLDGTVENYDISVSQNGNVYTTTDSEGSSVVVADGVERELEPGIVTSITCVGNSIEIVLNGDVPASNEGPAVTIDSLTTIIPSGSVVTMETNTTVKVPAYGIEEEQHSMTTCQRK